MKRINNARAIILTAGLLVIVILMQFGYAECERTVYCAEDTSRIETFETVYHEGQYKCGVDIEEGEYVLISNGDMAYFQIATDANGDDIKANGIFYANSIITIQENDYVDLQYCFAVNSDEFYSKYYNDSGVNGVMLKVGAEYDILPGEYKLTAIGGCPYYAIYNDSNHDDIVSNKIFDNSTYVEVNEGQYIELSDCIIE